MKKLFLSLLFLLTISVHSTASAFWSWDSITDAFQKNIIERFFVSETEEEIEYIQEDTRSDEDLDRLERIKQELRILQESGVEALKEYEQDNLIFEETPFDSEESQEILERVQSENYGTYDPSTDTKVVVEESEIETIFEEIPVNFLCNTIVTEFNPTRKYYFATLPYGSENQHTEILRYKIKWFDGNWSGWFVPGVNDKDWQGDRHFWSNFADHQYKVEHCENYQYSPLN